MTETQLETEEFTITKEDIDSLKTDGKYKSFSDVTVEGTRNARFRKVIEIIVQCGHYRAGTVFVRGGEDGPNWRVEPESWRKNNKFKSDDARG